MNLFLFNQNIFLAYVDPSVMTYTVQAIAGVIIALGAVFGIAWRVIRKKAQKVLKIDEKANKEVEEDVQVIDCDAGQNEK